MKRTSNMKKRAITLVELLVVMALIAVISGALAFNYKESLDKGRAFKSEQLAERVKSILMMEVAKDPTLIAQNTVTDWAAVLKKTGHIQPTSSKAATGTPADYLDAWGNQLGVSCDAGEVKVTSAGLEEWKKNH